MPLIPVSTEIQVKLGIEQGRIYNFAPENGVANHYYVVVNKDPKKDGEIYLVAFTHDEIKILNLIKLRNLDPLTHVKLAPGECAVGILSTGSNVNCNYVKRLSVEKLIELVETTSNETMYPVLDSKVVSRIIVGVKASKMVGNDIKSCC